MLLQAIVDTGILEDSNGGVLEEKYVSEILELRSR